MNSEIIYKMLPKPLKKFRNKVIAKGGEFDLEFDDFVDMTIETIKRKKKITSALVLTNLTTLEWYYKGPKFYIEVNGRLEVVV